MNKVVKMTVTAMTVLLMGGQYRQRLVRRLGTKVHQKPYVEIGRGKRLLIMV